MINLQPAFAELPAYRPVVFETYIDILSALVAENALVTILKNGVSITTDPIIYKSSSNEPSTFPGATKYNFTIDIQKYVQDSLGPTDQLPSTFFKLPAFGNITNIDLFADFSISVTYEFIDSVTGLLVPVPLVPDVSNDFTIYSIAKQSTAPLFEAMDLTLQIGLPVLQETLFLTKSSRVLEVCETDNAFLSVIQPNISTPINGFEVRLYDAAGGLLTFGYGATTAPPFSQMHTINSGKDYLAAQIYVGGTPDFTDVSLSYYTVSFGYLTTLVGPSYLYVIQTELFTYEITSKCCGSRDLRLHWTNLLAGTDSYTFNSEKDLQLTATSDRSQKALNWRVGSSAPHNVNDVGSFKTNSEGSTAYIVKSRFLTNTEATWLLELLTSPKVYADLEGAFIPVNVSDKIQSIERHEGKIQFEIEIVLANEFIIQRI